MKKEIFKKKEFGQKKTLRSLRSKLHPRHFTGMSPKMGWIVSVFLGTDWAAGPRGEKPIGSFSITSDGFVQIGNMFIGGKKDFERNLITLLHAAKLNMQEATLFSQLYADKVQDWSIGCPGRGQLLVRI